MKMLEDQKAFREPNKNPRGTHSGPGLRTIESIRRCLGARLRTNRAANARRLRMEPEYFGGDTCGWQEVNLQIRASVGAVQHVSRELD
jgi:hypothetical protein